MHDALINYGKYLVIQPQGVTADHNVTEPVCFKFKVTMHDDGGHPYEYQFTNGEIIRLLQGKTKWVVSLVNWIGTGTALSKMPN